MHFKNSRCRNLKLEIGDILLNDKFVNQHYIHLPSLFLYCLGINFESQCSVNGYIPSFNHFIIQSFSYSLIQSFSFSNSFSRNVFIFDGSIFVIKIPAFENEILPLCSETTIAIASDCSVTPTAALCLNPKLSGNL